MFDDLRDSANDQGFPDGIDDDLEPLLNQKSENETNRLKFNSANFLGMTAFQRFVLSALLFLLVIILGFMFVMITSSTLST